MKLVFVATCKPLIPKKYFSEKYFIEIVELDDEKEYRVYSIAK